MTDHDEMHVIKRNNTREEISFDKILRRVKKLGTEANININYSALVIKVIDQLYDNIETTKIDELTAEQCASMSIQHPDYGILAGRIVVSNHQKNTNNSFIQTMEALYNFKDIHHNHTPLISHEMWKNIKIINNILNLTEYESLDNIIEHDHDYLIDYFGFKTIERSYLLKINKIVVERPQYMWMRVAIGIHETDISSIIETYNLLSLKYFTHATPTLFNAGTPRPQLSSCYLLAMEDDSVDGIYNTLKDCAKISKWAGGIGLHINNIRAKGSHIRGTNGVSNGIAPMLRVFNNTARYIDQGGGRRNGSFAIYLEPWHADVEIFLEMRKNHGDEEQRARDLFYALWIPDLFMKRIKDDQPWTLMCPDECPGLADVYGDEFEQLYIKYENDNRGRKQINARELWFRILDSQMETGTPYLLYKDACNSKSNQKNLGTIKSSNLCCEIMEFSSSTETAVCNLASIGLNKFVTDERTFDYNKLHTVTKVITNNLNKIIDVNFYPTEKTRRSNLLHRPIGVGVQGLADVFMLMDIPFYSEEATNVNKNIFETIYHAALECSNEIAKLRNEQLNDIYDNSDYFNFNFSKSQIQDYEVPHTDTSGLNTTELNLFNYLAPIKAELLYLTGNHKGSYSTFEGSPASKGILQFDMWGVTPSDRYDWNELKENIIEYGLRNSLLVAPMPTASTSQILGNNECFEPITSNIYTRRTIAGEFIVANKYLIKELLHLGLWNNDIKENIIRNNGSIQHIDIIPQEIRDKYRTVWEIPMKHMIDMAKDRGAFICQSQSLNLWLEDPNYNTLTSMHFYSWKQGLKTGIYYLRRKAKHQPQQFTIAPTQINNVATDVAITAPPHVDNTPDDICEMCSG
jgi:ribonucleoside-diphosphate reductase alpha chain